MPILSKVVLVFSSISEIYFYAETSINIVFLYWCIPKVLQSLLSLVNILFMENIVDMKVKIVRKISFFNCFVNKFLFISFPLTLILFYDYKYFILKMVNSFLLCVFLKISKYKNTHGGFHKYFSNSLKAHMSYLLTINNTSKADLTK